MILRIIVIILIVIVIPLMLVRRCVNARMHACTHTTSVTCAPRRLCTCLRHTYVIPTKYSQLGWSMSNDVDDG